MSFHRESVSLVIGEQDALPTEFHQQGFDLSIVELNDFLLAFVDQSAENGE